MRGDDNTYGPYELCSNTQFLVYRFLNSLGLCGWVHLGIVPWIEQITVSSGGVDMLSLIFTGTVIFAFLSGMFVHWFITGDERRLLKEYERHNAQTEMLDQRRAQLQLRARQLHNRRRKER